MKYLKVTILAFLAVVSFGCSSDDNNGGSNQITASIVGTWDAVDIEVEGDVSTVIEGNNIVVPVVGTPSNIDYTVVFTEDNQVSAVGSFDLELTASFLGEVYTVNLDNLNPVGVGTYATSGNNLSVLAGGETQVYRIEELSEELLTVVTSEVFETIEDGRTFTTELDFRIYFERQ